MLLLLGLVGLAHAVDVAVMVPATTRIGVAQPVEMGEPYFRLSRGEVITATVVSALFLIFVVGKGISALRLPTKTGVEAMIGQTAAAVTAIDAASGKVFIEGEYWNAVSDAPIAAGQLVEVVAVRGLTLTVQSKDF